MGYKKVCLKCRATFNRPIDFGSGLTYPCPQCGSPMTLLPHRFRPPHKSDDKSWELVTFLIDHGFPFQHIYQEVINKQLKRETSYVPYPSNLMDAKEFVLKYKSQAIKPKL